MTSSAVTSIDVSPLVGEFSDVECGKLFVIPFTVRNVSSKMCRIRCVPPESKCFRLLSTQQTIAPGMKQAIELEFSSNTPGEVHDRLVIRCDEGDIVIPVHAWFPTPNIQFAPVVDFGQVTVNHPVESKKLKLKNTGRKDGVFKFVLEGAACGASINPMASIVPAGRETEVLVHLFPTVAGPVRCAYSLQVEGQTSGRTLSVRAEAMEARVVVVRPGTNQTVNQVDFGRLYYGQKREIQLQIQNQGQNAVSFNITPPKLTEAVDMDQPDEYPIQVFPREGRLARNGSATLTFTFAPQMLEQRQGWANAEVNEKSLRREWDRESGRFSIDLLEIEQSIELAMMGVAVPTIVRASEKLCRFGECPANEFVDIPVFLENLNSDLPVFFELNRVAHFTCKPARGVIDPKGRVELQLTFQPKQLGSFEDKFVVSVNGGIKKIPIMLMGNSSSIGQKAPRASGIDAIKEDFKRQPNYKRNMNIPQRAAPVQHTVETDVLLRPEHEQKLQHNRLYNQYLQNSRAIRDVRRDAKSRTQENPDDLGMIPAEGLIPPEPELPKHVDRLVFAKDLAKGKANDHGPGGVKQNVDVTKWIKKKFRKEPSNLNEMRECKLVLSPKDLQGIHVAPRVIEFGEVSVYSVNKKQLCITNNLKTHIHVAIAFTREELSQSTPNSQVIPPGQVAGFDITFYAESAQSFMQATYFTINDAHRLKFVVTAEAKAVDVNMSHSDLNFRFPDFGQDMSVTQNVFISNPGNSDASFQWVMPPGVPPNEVAFSFNPAAGIIPASSPGSAGGIPIAVTYTPPIGINASEVVAQLKVIGAAEPKYLTLSGSVPASTCTWHGIKDNRIDFKKISVGTVKSHTITIKNNGTAPTVYAFDTTLLHQGMSLSQTRGRIPGGGSEDVQLRLMTSLPDNLKCSLSCHVRGMRQLLKATITAEAKVPDMTILDPPEVDELDASLDFGDVYVGSSESRRISIQNHDDITASLVFDLRQFPQFTLLDSDRRPIQTIVPDDEDSFVVDAFGGVHIIPVPSQEKGDEGTVYRVTINSKQTFHFFLCFTPTISDIIPMFQLPVSLVGCEVVTEALRPLRVAAVGKSPKLSITPTLADFGARVVVRDGTSKLPHRITIALKNETDADIIWELDGNKRMAEANPNEVFRIEPTSGKMAPGQVAYLQVTFAPTEIRSYAANYNIYLDGSDQRYMTIQAKGFGVNPGLCFDRKEVIMPPVPLDTPAVSTFYIGNDGYESLDLKYTIAGDNKLPIQLRFPEGSVLSSSSGLIPVEVHFLSKKPITFTVNIDFYDDISDGLFAIPVTCTADNSVLTCYGYMKTMANRSLLQAEGDRKPVMFKLKDNLPAPKGESTIDDEVMGSFLQLDTAVGKSNTQRQLERIRMWFNSNVLSDVVDDLIGSLQLNGGKMLVDIIEMLFGKPPQIPKPSQPKEGIAGIVESYDSILLFMKQYGACVSEVRSEYLIRYEDYLKLAPQLESQGIKVISSRTRTRPIRLPEHRFNVRNTHAWLTVLTQTIRAFFFTRIGWKTLRNLPNSPAIATIAAAEKWGPTSDPTVAGSNVYSVAEGVLLRWLSAHLTYFFGPSKGKELDVEKDRLRVTNFTSDLRDCRAFAACVMGYIPSSIPRLVGSDFGIVAAPVSEDDKERNAACLLAVLEDYGLHPRVTAHELLEGSALDNALFAAYLFNSLPQYVPKTTIRFKGKVLDTITKHIELSNPTKWPVDYDVSIDGSEKFKINETKIHLEPKASTSFAISITPCFAKKAEALCMFRSNRGSATMVFSLETDIDADSAIHTFDELQSPLYDVLNYEVVLENPFPTSASSSTFNVQIQQEFVKGDKPMPEEASLPNFPDAFWSPADSVTIRKNDKCKFNLQFLPCVRGTYKARVVFHDDLLGEFAYKFVAKGLPPRPFDSIALQTEASTPVTHEVQIPLRHSALDKALSQRHERLKSMKAGTRKNQGKESETEGKEAMYKVEFLSEKYTGANPFFQGPKTFYLTKPGNDNAQTAVKASKAAAQGQSFTINFTPRNPGTYNGILLLTSPWDVRAIAIEGKSRSPGMKAELEFHCPARQLIVQDIPITNGSESEWVVAAILQGEFFSGPREVRIPAGKTKNYSLAFNPSWVCDVTGQLVLRNNDTQEKYTYVLKGKADEPLAENTIPIECRARESRKIVVSVNNITYDDVTYQVITDLPFVSGAPTLFVPKGEQGRYTLIISPQLNGKVTGSLTFMAPNKQYVWFVIQATVARPPPEDTITINADVRSGAVAEISIANPKDKRVDFLVRRKGEGLFGDDLLTVEPRESAVYQLAYAPTRASETEGVVSFNNDDIGEFWYKLKMIAKPAPPMDLAFQCEIGKSSSQEIALQNPLDTDCHMTVSSTNDINFSVSPQNLILRSQPVRVTITYTPSAIQVAQEAVIIFSHPRAGVWEYRCKGSGTPPTRMDPVKCIGQVGTASSMIVSFRNPFPVPRKFIPTLISGAPAFALMQKRAPVTLGPFQAHQIPVSYSPMEITQHEGQVAVEAMDQQEGAALRWEFPIQGTAESFSTAGAIRLTCRSRKESRIVLPLQLSHLKGAAYDEDMAPQVIVDGGAKYFKAASNSIVAAIVEKPSPSEGGNAAAVSATAAANNDPSTLYVEFTFAPLRPFVVAAELLLKRREGGMWRFPLNLESQPPEVDDVIELEAAVNVIASANFQLYNVLPQPRPFLAYFTPDSPQEFSVLPSKGTLPPMPKSSAEAASSGQQMIVKFASIQYGKTLTGTLVVDTEDMQWRYEVRGSLPKYKPPTNVESKLFAGTASKPQPVQPAGQAGERKVRTARY